MADEPTNSGDRKRTVKNPETFRERALKANIEDDKPQSRTVAAASIKEIFKPVRTFGQTLAKVSVFKPLHRPLRIIGKIVFPTYFRKSWQELKLVTWPSWKLSVRLTYAVLIFAVVFGAAVAIIDVGLDAIFKKILLK